MDLPFDRFLNLVYFRMTDGASQTDRDRIDAHLQMPLRTSDPADRDRQMTGTVWDPQEELSAFEDAARTFGDLGS